MSPLRRRKRRSGRPRTRRQQLVERERFLYRREQETEAGEGPGKAPPAGGREGPKVPPKSPGRRLLKYALRALALLLALALRLADLLARAMAAIWAGIVGAARRTLAFGERYATPDRVLVLVIAGAAACLGVSQFVAYRGVEVGQAQYSDVSTIAPPPQTDRIDAGAAHAYVLLPLAAIALAIALLALLSGRWRLARLISLVGLVGIAISLAIDLPKGLDAGTAATAFAGANATLTEGFYAQLAASAVLVLCGWVLGQNLRARAGAVEGRRLLRRRRGPRPRRAPSVAGGGA
jgi:hypothetical protein